MTPSWHCFSPFHVSLVAERCRHVAVAIPEVRISCGIAVSQRQKSVESQRPDFAYYPAVIS